MLGGAKKNVGGRGLAALAFILMPPIRRLAIILYVDNMTIR